MTTKVTEEELYYIANNLMQLKCKDTTALKMVVVDKVEKAVVLRTMRLNKAVFTGLLQEFYQELNMMRGGI